MSRNTFDESRFTFGIDRDGRPIAYRPNEVIVKVPGNDADVLANILTDAAAAVATKHSDESDPITFEVRREISEGWRVIGPVGGTIDPVRVARALRKEKRVAQPNHIYFVNTLGVSPNYIAPNYIAPNYIAPNYIAPNYIAPNYIAPNYIAPNYIAPNYIAPNYIATRGHAGGCACGACPEAPGADRLIPTITAKRAWGPVPGPPVTEVPAGSVKIHVLDVRAQTAGVSAIAAGDLKDLFDEYGQALEPDRDALRTSFKNTIRAQPGAVLPRVLFLEDVFLAQDETNFLLEAARYLVEPESSGLGANVDGDDFVDPVTNHAAFIGGIIDRVVVDAAGRSVVEHHAIAGTLGDVSDDELAKAMDDVRTSNPQTTVSKIMSLSLSGYSEDDRPPPVLADAVKNLQAEEWLVVASAGNNSSCRLAWPGALPGVVSVSAYGSSGPAFFSNYGPWVDACGPGVDIVSTFPRINANANGPLRVAGADMAEDFDPKPNKSDDVAVWSGTSFSAPYVAAQIAARAAADGTQLNDAVGELIRHPDAVRIPNYGAIVSDTTTRVTVVKGQ